MSSSSFLVASLGFSMYSIMSVWLLYKRKETASVGEDAEKKESMCTVGANVNWCSHYGKQCAGFLKN